MGGASKWIMAAKEIASSFLSSNTASSPTLISCSGTINTAENEGKNEDIAPKIASDKNLCAICLDPLHSYVDDGPKNEDIDMSSGVGDDKNKKDGSKERDYRDASSDTVFTAECRHVFHLVCAVSNVRHGGVTCPVCRSHWTQLPRLSNTTIDPVLRILDDSITSLRVSRQAIMSSALYNDDDPIGQQAASVELSDRPHLYFALVRSPTSALTIKLSHERATDLVLVAGPNGPHLRLQKQSMALVALSLRPIDRLSIVTYSASAAARVLPLRRMSSQGKRVALQAIDRVCYSAEAEPTEGLRKGVKILNERTHRNPRVVVLHLSGKPTTTDSYVCNDLEFPVPVHEFYIGCEFGTLNGVLMHRFEEFLAELIAGAIRDAQVKVGSGEWVRIGEMRAGNERQIPVKLTSNESITVVYSYVSRATVTNGETVVTIKESSDNSRSHGRESARDWSSCVDKWEYVDPLIARRWAKHLHGQKT